MEIVVADTFIKRLRGRLFTDEILMNEVLLLKDCKQVHSFGMNYDLCVLYLDEDYDLISSEILRKNKIGSKYKNTRHIIEVNPKFHYNRALKNSLVKRVKEEVNYE